MANLAETVVGSSQSAVLVPDTNQMISHSSLFLFFEGTDPTLTPVRATPTAVNSTGSETIGASGLSTVLNTRAVTPGFGTGSLGLGSLFLHLLANQVSYVAWRGDYRRQYSAYWSFRITGERYGLYFNNTTGGDLTVFHLTQPRADTYRNFRRGRNPFFFYCAGTINNHQKTGAGAYQLHVAHQNNDGLLWVDGRAWRLGNSQSDFFDILLFPPANVFPVGLTATLNFVGTFGPTQINKNLTATFSPTGLLVKSMGKNFTATVSFVGVLTMGRAFVRAFTATLTFVGSLTTIRTFIRNFTANLNFTGVLTKLPQKQFTATLTPAGLLTKRLAKTPFTATLSFVGVLGASKFFMRAFTATTNFTGALNKQVGKNFTASLWAAGVPTLLDSYSEVNQDNFLSLSSSFSFGAGQAFNSGAGGTLDSCKFNITKVSTPTGNAVARLYTVTGTFGSSELPTGAPLAESDPFDVSTLPVSPTYALITFNFTGANRYVMAPATDYGIEVEYNGGGSTPRIQVGIDASAGTHPGNAFRLNSNSTWSLQSAGNDFPFYLYIGGGWGNLTKRVVKAPFTATLTFAGTLSKRMSKTFAATLSSTGNLAAIKLFLRAFTATLNFTGNLNRRTGKSFAATLAFTTTFTKNVRKVFSATLSFAGSLATQLNGGVHLFFQEFTANLVFAGVLTKRSTKSMTATLSFVGNLAIGRFFVRAFTATLTFTGLLRRQTGKNLTATQTFTATFTKRISKQLTATLAPTAVLTKRMTKSFTAVTSFIGILTRTRVFVRVFTATLAFSGNLKKVLGKNFLADLVFSGELNKKTYKFFTATLSFVGILQVNLVSTWAYYINLIKGAFKPTQSSLDVTKAESTLGRTDAESGDFKNVKTNDDS